MDDEIVQEVKEVLKEIYEVGFEITESLKKQYNLLSSRPTEEILIGSELFSYSLFELFWRLFKRVSENIENPLTQTWIRIIIEQASDFIWCSKNKNNDVVCKYWLCCLGFVGGKQRNLEYDKFLELLQNPKTKFRFLKLKNDGYPVKKIHKEFHNLFPAISEDCLPSFIEKYFLNTRGNSINKKQLDMFYRNMSFYHHPSILMNKIDYEFEDKSHLFRCFTLISFCGMGLIKYSTEKLLKDSEDSFDNLNKKISNLIKKLYDKRTTQNE
jgi:hypothetical protein